MYVVHMILKINDAMTLSATSSTKCQQIYALPVCYYFLAQKYQHKYKMGSFGEKSLEIPFIYNSKRFCSIIAPNDSPNQPYSLSFQPAVALSNVQWGADICSAKDCPNSHTIQTDILQFSNFMSKIIPINMNFFNNIHLIICCEIKPLVNNGYFLGEICSSHLRETKYMVVSL